MASSHPSSDRGLAEEDFPKGEAGLESPAGNILVGEAREIDPKVSRRVLRKIDWFLMPAMTIGESECSTDRPAHLFTDFSNRIWLGILRQGK